MVNTKELIKENNEKRDRLTEQNEQYYTDLLIYMRSKFLLSERATEELLIEMLDHLLEAQTHGKTAEEVFGKEPKAYADELIEQLPKEKKKNQVLFITQLTVNVLGWLFIVRGLVLGVPSFFTKVDQSLYLVSGAVMVFAVLAFTAIGITFLLRMVNKSAFSYEQKKWKYAIGGGIIGALFFGLLASISVLVKDLGPVIEFPWWMSLIVGVILLGISKGIERKAEKMILG